MSEIVPRPPWRCAWTSDNVARAPRKGFLRWHALAARKADAPGVMTPVRTAALLLVGLATALSLGLTLSRRLDAFDDTPSSRQVETFRWGQHELDVYP